jgi:hypothetical protein
VCLACRDGARGCSGGLGDGMMCGEGVQTVESAGDGRAAGTWGGAGVAGV